MSGYLMIAIAVVFGAAASYCLKLGAAASASVQGFLAMALQPPVLAAMICYAASFGAYALALQKIPLTLAQPAITACVSILTTLIAVAVLGERMSVVNWCGLAFICTGIVLLSSGKLG
ncbi:MAG: DMT family transporter [Telluria sp.]